MNLGELEKEVFSVLSETAKTLKTELWTCVNCENPDKKASFVKVEIILSLKEMNESLKKLKDSIAKNEENPNSIMTFLKNLKYIHERSLNLNLPKVFLDYLEAHNKDNEKRKNWTPEEIGHYLESFVTKKEGEAIINEENNDINPENPENNLEEDNVGDEWDDASNIEDDVMFVDDEEIKELDAEVFNEDNKDDISDVEEEKDHPPQKHEKIDESLKSFKGHKDFVLNVNFHPINPSIFCSCSGDDTAAIWDLERPEPLFVLKEHKDTISFANFNYEGNLLATGSMDGSIRIWDVKTGKLRNLLEGPSDEIRFLDWHKKGNALVAGSADNTIWLWNANNGEFMHIFQGHSAAVTAGGFTPEGHYVISVSEDASLRVWNPKNGEAFHKISGYGFHTEIVTCLAFHQNLPVVLTGSTDKTACLSNFSTGKVLGRTMEHLDGIESVMFSQNLEIFFTGSIDGHLRIFDSAKFILKDDIVLDSGITKIGFDPNDPYCIIASSFEGKLHRLDQRKRGTDLKSLSAGSTIHDFAINKKSEVICACEDGVIRFFDLKI